MKIDYSVIRNPSRYTRYDKEWDCYFCRKKSKPVFLFGMIKGGHFVCGLCKNKIIEHFDRENNAHENLINNKNMLSGGIWESNRRKH